MQTQEFHAIRRTRVFGTDSAAVAGQSKYTTKFQVYLEKVGEADPFQGNKFTEAGTALESGIATLADLPFQAELVREVGAGLVIPMADPAALAQAVAALAAEPEAAQA